MSLKEQFLAFKCETQKVTIPQWGIDLYLKTMTAAERFSLLQSIEGKSGIEFSAAIVVRCLCDENGIRLFDDSEESIAAILSKDSAVIEQLTLMAMQLNKMTAESKEEVKKN